jgi:hypothetical protein
MSSRSAIQLLVPSVLLLHLLALPAALAAQEGEDFVPGCNLPFAAIAVQHPIDSGDAGCGIAGKAAADDANHAQNRAKNNFCAAGDPVTLTRDDFVKLQAAVDGAGIPYGSPKRLPPDRKVLHDLVTTAGGATVGEGSKVRFVTLILGAHYSDTKSGESVNCGEPGNEPNDIHVPTVQAAGAEECESITVEMSPHGRPAGWTPKALQKAGAPVRITGQLFFDASHKPCIPGKQRNPKRIASWEIHPVYAVDVCTATTLAECPVDDESKWRPLAAPPAAPAAPPESATPPASTTPPPPAR